LSEEKINETKANSIFNGTGKFIKLLNYEIDRAKLTREPLRNVELRSFEEVKSVK
jgi:hypothetical protein